MSPVRNGIALAVTVGAGYAACTLAFWAWPEFAMMFMNGLFHGLNFRKLEAPGILFSFGGFAYGLVGLMVWTFLLGALFAWLRSTMVREN